MHGRVHPRHPGPRPRLRLQRQVADPGTRASCSSCCCGPRRRMGDYPGYNEGGIRGTGGGEIDPVENLGRYHYFKEIFLDSSDDGEPAHRPAEAARRGQHHAHEVGRRDPGHDQQHDPVGALLRPRLHPAQPGLPGPRQGAGLPAEDFDWMASIAGPLDVRGWKLYCGWGDPGLGAIGGEGPSHNGWWFDDDNGMAIVEHIRRIQAEDEPAGGHLHPQGPGLQRDVRLGQVLARGTWASSAPSSPTSPSSPTTRATTAST